MSEKVVGGCAAVGCFLLGGFLTFASFVAVLDDGATPILYALAAAGVALLVGGVLLLWNISRRRPAKRARDPEESW